MSFAKQILEPRADYLALEEPALLRGFELLATAANGITTLRKLVLKCAVEGRLTTRTPSDAPARTLLNEVARVRQQAVLEGLLRRSLSEQRTNDGWDSPIPLPHGWEWATLDQISPTSLKDGDWIETKDQDPNGGIRLIQLADVGEAEFLDKSSRFINQATFERLGCTDLQANDVLIARLPNPIGRACVFPGLKCKAITAVDVAILRTNGLCDAQYLVHAINSDGVRSQIEAYGKGATRFRVSTGHLKAITLPLPPLAEQHRIVARVEELMTLCDELEARGRLADEQHAHLTTTLFDALTASDSAQTLADNWQRIATHLDLLLDRPQTIDALEQTILQLAVRGLLVPQDASDEPASKLLSHVRAGRDHLIAKGELKRDKPLLAVTSDEEPFPPNSGWLWTRIAQFCEVQGGIQKTPLRRPVKNHYPYLRVANVQRNALQLDEIERYELTDDEVEKWRLRSGDLLVVEGNGSENEIGRCAIWDGSIDPCVFQNHLIRVRPDVASTVEFLKLFLNSPDGTAEMKRLAITTSGLFNLSVGKIRNIPVPLPPLAEQHRIVARVEHLRSLCDDLRGRLNKVRATQTHLAEAVVTEAVQPQRGVRLS